MLLFVNCHDLVFKLDALGNEPLNEHIPPAHLSIVFNPYCLELLLAPLVGRVALLQVLINPL